MKTKEIKEAEIKRLLKKIRESARISLSFRIKMFFRLRGKMKELREPSHFGIWQKSFTGALAAMFILIGTGSFAYANPSVMNGTILYPVKRAIEKVEEKLQRTNEEKIKFHARMMERRIEESEKLAERGTTDKETIEMITREFEKSVAEIDITQGTDQQKNLLMEIQKRLNKDRVQMLVESERETYRQLNERITKHFNFIETRIKGTKTVENPEPGNVTPKTPQRIMPKTPFVPKNNATPLPVINPGAKPSGTPPFTSEPESQTPTRPVQAPRQTQPISGEPGSLN